MSDEVVLARAYLSRVAEPACLPLWRAIDRFGPVQVARDVRSGSVPPELAGPTQSRARSIDPHLDLEAAERLGIRVLTPESDEWPHIALGALDGTARKRSAAYDGGRTAQPKGGERVPPVALWVRGPLDLSALSLRSVAIVGARASTAYGDDVAARFAQGLADHDFEIVSGGAVGIDRRAHLGALAVDGRTVLVTAGGVDVPYPVTHRTLFDQVAGTGAVVSESPPGSEPRRHRFLSRNRLIAAFATGTIVVEAARRSGALNTAGHCRALGRRLMAVPGPITSAASAGCHALLSETGQAALVDDVASVLDQIGSSSDLPDDASALREGEVDERDRLDDLSRLVLEGLPGRGAITADRLAISSGLPIRDVLRTLPGLEIASLVARDRDGTYRLVRRPTRRESEQFSTIGDSS